MKKKEEKDNNIEEKKVTKKSIIKKKKENDIEVIDKTVEFSLTEVIIIILITGIVVSIASGLIVYNNYDRLSLKNDYSISYGELDEFIKNYNKILNNYVEEVDKKELLDAAIGGMYNYLGDDYSTYMSKEDTDSLEQQLNGEYTGVGIEIKSTIKENGELETTINRIFKDSPAEKAGLKAGDVLLKIDDSVIEDASSLANTIKNGDKETFNITYKRDGKENTVKLTRSKVFINSVTSEEYGNVGYIKIETFSSTTVDQVTNVINSFSKNINSVVIDVRDNTGGYLDAAYKTADLFIEKDKNIYLLKDRSKKIKEYKAVSGVLRKFNKISVLINNGSASASEILALALKESAGATIVGVNSYGKGTVQETDILESGAMVKYTSAYWLSPNGNSINKTGIKPDIEVKEVEKQLSEAIKAVE